MKKKVCIKTQLEEFLKELHLSTIKDGFEKTAKLAAEESFSYEEYLLELLGQERQARSQRRIGRRLRESRLPLEKSLSCFDKSRLPQKVKQQLNQLLQGSFKQKENILAFGNPGTGKTHLIDSLIKKPGAFENYRYKEDLFPSTRFRTAYDVLRSQNQNSANKIYLKILYLAARASESSVDVALAFLLEQKISITVANIEKLVNKSQEISGPKHIKIDSVHLDIYDTLLTNGREGKK